MGAPALQEVFHLSVRVVLEKGSKSEDLSRASYLRRTSDCVPEGIGRSDIGTPNSCKDLQAQASTVSRIG